MLDMIQISPFHGNCRGVLVYNFSDYNTKKVSDKTWKLFITRNGLDEYRFVSFSGADHQAESPTGPQAFAKWLKSKGEKVTATRIKRFTKAEAKEYSAPQGHVVVYTWAVSDKLYTG